MTRQTNLSGGFNIPVPSKLYPFREEKYDCNVLFEILLRQEKPAFGKMNKTNSDAHLNFFMHCKRYFRTEKLLREAAYTEP